MRIVKQLVYALFMSIWFNIVYALPPSWEIIHQESSLTFTAVQNDASVHGSFSYFNGEIVFDLNDLQHSYIHIVVPLSSLQSSFAELKTTLLSSDWFDVQKYPNAIYEARIFEKKDNGEFLAKGTLTLRGKTSPLVLIFKPSQPSEELGLVVGYTEIRRLDFGVGQGEWSSTQEIKNAVRVDFKIMGRRIKK